jgi:hypothetical protein
MLRPGRIPLLALLASSRANRPDFRFTFFRKKGTRRHRDVVGMARMAEVVVGNEDLYRIAA